MKIGVFHDEHNAKHARHGRLLLHMRIPWRAPGRPGQLRGDGARVTARAGTERAQRVDATVKHVRCKCRDGWP